MKKFVDKLIGRLEEKFKYNSEQAEIYRDGSDKDAYFREKKDLYMDRANTYGEVMRIVNRLTEEYINTSTDTSTNSLDASTNTSTTNADRIRSMTDEELAEFLLKVNCAYTEPCMIGEKDCKWDDYPTHDKGCKDCFLDWLQSEVEGVTENE